MIKTKTFVNDSLYNLSEFMNEFFAQEDLKKEDIISIKYQTYRASDENFDSYSVLVVYEK